MKKSISLITILIIFTSAYVFAFDNKSTHPHITDEAVSKSKLNGYLVHNINLREGTKAKINGITIIEIIDNGSKLEDVPPCRASNHFHNPLRNWYESGMRDQPWYINSGCSGSEYPPEDISSNIHWATGYIEPAPGNYTQDTGNEWDWAHAREYFYLK